MLFLTSIRRTVLRHTQESSEALDKGGKLPAMDNIEHVPKNWKTFLRDDDNKAELFSMLAKSIYSIPSGLGYATHNASSVCNKIDRNTIACTHEEADTRIFIHLKHAIEKDLIRTACILSNDTDVIIIALSYFAQLKALGLEQLWVSFGTGKRRRWLPIHDLSAHLGPEKSKGLLFFHAFSGCDTVSGFRGKGKKSFLQTCNVFPDITETFAKLSRFPVSISDMDVYELARFVVLLYDRASPFSDVNAARKTLFMQKGTQFDHLPPTMAALTQHIKRAVYQGGIIWGQALEADPKLLPPGHWGWIKNSDNSWNIYWTDLSPISDICKELCKCSCKKQCSARCSCRKSNLQCTSICTCSCMIGE